MASFLDSFLEIQKYLHALGRLLAKVPERVLHGMSWLIGYAAYALMPKRRRIVRSNLSHAFPDRSSGWHQSVARATFQQAVEMGLLLLLLPVWSESKLKRRFQLTHRAKTQLDAISKSNQGSLCLLPHMSLSESFITIPLLYGGSLPALRVLFRPLRQAGLNHWVTQTRQRFGMHLLSRHQGLRQAYQALAKSELLALLFDQHAGNQGRWMPFMGRYASTTALPEQLFQKQDLDVYWILPKRTGFLRAQLDIEPMDLNALKAKGGDVMATTHSWLEGQLRTSASVCESWLWLHDRWRVDSKQPLKSPWNLSPRSRKAQANPKSEQPESLQATRSFRVWVRLPNWLGDIVMTLPLLRALCKDRPDIELTLLAQPAYVGWLQSLSIAHRVKALPKQDMAYFLRFFKFRSAYADLFLVWPHSLRTDIEALLIGAPYRLGMLKPGQWARPFLTHVYSPSQTDRKTHQGQLGARFLKQFGMENAIDLSPIKPYKPKSLYRIGMICGSENTPEKRWPVSHWRSLIEGLERKLPNVYIVLFGTQRDRELTTQVAKGFHRVENMAGKTQVSHFSDGLSACSLVIANDTGGMHLASALGVPVLALFGPTNPSVSGPLFSGPSEVLQSPDGLLINLQPERVLQAAIRLLQKNTVKE